MIFTTQAELLAEKAVFHQGLQQKNLELLTVVRQLGAEKDQERALVEQEKARDREALEAEKNALHAERAKQQVLFILFSIIWASHLLIRCFQGLMWANARGNHRHCLSHQYI